MADALNGTLVRAERLQPVGQIERRKGIGALGRPPKVECYITLLPPAKDGIGNGRRYLTT